MAAVMDLLRDRDDRLVYWVLRPPMREGDLDALPGDQRRRPARGGGPAWIEIVEAAPRFGDAGGRDLAGLRQRDGIHRSREGADLLAEHLVGLVEAELTPRDRGPRTTTTAPG